MLVYRYAFEEFRNYTNVLAMYVEAGIIKRIDLGPVEYYWARLNERNNPELGKIFISLLEAYYSRRVLPWVLEADPTGVGTGKPLRFKRHYGRLRIHYLSEPQIQTEVDGRKNQITWGYYVRRIWTKKEAAELNEGENAERKSSPRSQER